MSLLFERCAEWPFRVRLGCRRPHPSSSALGGKADQPSLKADFCVDHQ